MRSGEGLCRFVQNLCGLVRVQHSRDRFLASSAVPLYAASGIDRVRRFRARVDGIPDSGFVQSIADADDHRLVPTGYLLDMVILRVIVNCGIVASSCHWLASALLL